MGIVAFVHRKPRNTNMRAEYLPQGLAVVDENEISQ